MVTSTTLKTFEELPQRFFCFIFYKIIEEMPMKKINLNIHMFIFLNLIAITIFNDIIIYLTNIEYNFSLLFSTILVCIFSVLIFKKNIQIQNS